VALNISTMPLEIRDLKARIPKHKFCTPCENCILNFPAGHQGQNLEIEGAGRIVARNVSGLLAC
jgi:hypothetical protein